jgi:hypothetical protein
MFPGAKIFAMSSSERQVEEVVSDCDEVVTNINTLIEKVDLAIIASPASYHAQHSLPFITKGIPVLIEKPVVASLTDANILIEASKKYATPIAVGYCLRYMPSGLVLHDLLSQQAIGTLLNARVCIGQFLPDWRMSKNYKDSVSASKALGGGALLELSHEFDYTRWLLGDLLIQHAIVRNSGILEIDVEDLVDVVATTEKGAVVNIHLDFLQRKAYRTCDFVGTKGRLEWNLINNELILHNASGTEIIYANETYDRNQMYLDMLADFVRLIDGHANNCILLDDSLTTVGLIEQIKKVAN